MKVTLEIDQGSRLIARTVDVGTSRQEFRRAVAELLTLVEEVAYGPPIRKGKR